MRRRFCVMLMTALTMLAADGVRADIGFIAAAATCRVAVPGQKLLALRHRHHQPRHRRIDRSSQRADSRR
ncbi:MAG: hypothetical protein DWI09_05285 [Planctomycetota bacterium]|nr:MAG: hypothetical protein DWI09_05285 [Planctomycetota bacterium]